MENSVSSFGKPDINLLFLVGRFLDLNLFNNLWSVFENSVHSYCKQYHFFDILSRKVSKWWRKVLLIAFNGLVDRMSKCCAAVRRIQRAKTNWYFFVSWRICMLFDKRMFEPIYLAKNLFFISIWVVIQVYEKSVWSIFLVQCVLPITLPCQIQDIILNWIWIREPIILTRNAYLKNWQSHNRYPKIRLLSGQHYCSPNFLRSMGMLLKRCWAFWKDFEIFLSF